MGNRFLFCLPILDELIAKDHPKKEDVEKLMNWVPHNAVIRQYFFDRLNNAEWVEPLWGRRIFRARAASAKKRAAPAAAGARTLRHEAAG
ncbi:MAG: hypothetical protein QHJ34_13985 [bacterium]|jgi:hypothetical protein|nr:hypothetical protein [candidate division KSB1 bacterium]MDH7561321.1 hypothetical protein [bacterium]